MTVVWHLPIVSSPTVYLHLYKSKAQLASALNQFQHSVAFSFSELLQSVNALSFEKLIYGLLFHLK